MCCAACAPAQSRSEQANTLPSPPPQQPVALDGDGGPHVANAEATIAAMRPSLRTCYNRGLAQDATMAGKIVMAIKIAPDGAVLDVTRVSGDGLAAEVEECMLGVPRRFTFEAPGGLGSTIQVPITFVQKR